MSFLVINKSPSNSIITPFNEGDVQPNAVDIRLERVLKVQPDVFELSEESKKHRSSVELKAEDGFWTIPPGVYDVLFDARVIIASGECGWVIPRSTLLRNGVTVNSGLYDSGYAGVVGAMMEVRVSDMRVTVNARVGQFILTQAATQSMYSGDYGSGKRMEQQLYGVQ